MIEFLGGAWKADLLRFREVERSFEAFLLKAPDIVALVDCGYFDLGIAPEEWFLEWAARHPERCGRFAFLQVWLPSRLSVFSAGEEWPPRAGRKVRIVTPYPALLKHTIDQMIAAEHAEIIPVVGSSEAFVGSVADYGFDCVESGQTLRRHGLSEVWIVITGASCGIGAATAMRLSKRRDVELVLIARDAANLSATSKTCQALGAHTRELAADLASPAGVDLVAAALQELDSLTGLVNVGSDADTVGFSGAAAYCASKAGLLGMTRALKAELQSKGVRLCVVSPGRVDTYFNGKRPGMRPGALLADEVAEVIEFALSCAPNIELYEIRLDSMSRPA